MTANPVRIGRILEHASDWRWFRIDRSVSSSCPASLLRPGDVIRVRAVSEDSPFRTGECRVNGTFDDFVHVERKDIAAIADMDHVYLTERRRPYAPGEKMTNRHPESVIAQVVEDVRDRCQHRFEDAHGRRVYSHCQSCGMPDPTVPPGEVRFAQPSAGEADFGAALERARAEHHDRVIDHLTKPMPRIDWAKLRNETHRVVTTCPGWNGVFTIDPVKAPYEQPARPDGFDQRQVDAARAALLAPAPPRYPRSR